MDFLVVLSAIMAFGGTLYAVYEAVTHKTIHTK